MKSKDILKWLENNAESVIFEEDGWRFCKVYYRDNKDELTHIIGNTLKDCVKAIVEE